MMSFVLKSFVNDGALKLWFLFLFLQSFFILLPLSVVFMWFIRYVNIVVLLFCVILVFIMKQINCSVDTCDYKNFQLFYPQCLSRFVRNCIRLAVRDRSFFNKLFFINLED